MQIIMSLVFVMFMQVPNSNQAALDYTKNVGGITSEITAQIFHFFAMATEPSADQKVLKELPQMIRTVQGLKTKHNSMEYPFCMEEIHSNVNMSLDNLLLGLIHVKSAIEKNDEHEVELAETYLNGAADNMHNARIELERIIKLGLYEKQFCNE